jgi:hypothetical protein
MTLVELLCDRVLFFVMPQVKKIKAITERFIAIHKHLKDIGELPDVKTLAEIMGYKSCSIISDILARRANIRPDAFNEFKGSFRACIPDERRLITECVNDALRKFIMKAAS